MFSLLIYQRGNTATCPNLIGWLHADDLPDDTSRGRSVSRGMMIKWLALACFTGALGVAKADLSSSLQALRDALGSNRLPEARDLLKDIYGGHPLPEIGGQLLHSPIRMARTPLDGIDQVLGMVNMETACSVEQLMQCQEAIFFLTRFAPRGAYRASW